MIDHLIEGFALAVVRPTQGYPGKQKKGGAPW